MDQNLCEPIEKTKNQGNTRYIYLMILFLFAALCLLRCFYGFDWSDETYYSTLSYRFIIGDSMFLHSWDIHQTSAIITLPLIYVFLLFTSGSTAGILLFLRIAYVIFQFCVCLYILGDVKKKRLYCRGGCCDAAYAVYPDLCQQF